ncbi:Molybdopterin synthase catalytic subunit [Coemansia sp. Cherry 401B]|nr:Molybdopterin synthase catalytic subunit [Coemansia sp. RSA 2705]KAJ2315296.1 Molybdopterin synthase catalytic subunit [Coemansia sp. RSA 2704]KAJ2727220.1 Molybdopterin synthase catalytic subunit [Coemansia sp. Cherry 401B]
MDTHTCCNHTYPEDYVPEHHKDANEAYDHFLISSEKLSLDQACDSVRTDAAGAISTFEGTTRNTFNGKRVIRLEYDAYQPLAKKEWYKIVQEARSKYLILGTVMHHRIGQVPVGHTSVIIAVSSAHRADAISAVHFLIDSLKVRLPIWKKELLDDGTDTWKQNEPIDLDTHKPIQH